MNKPISIIMGSQSDLETKWMIKKVCIGIIVSLVIYVSLIRLPYLFAQQENTEDAKEDNAAVYYLKAFDLLKYPNAGEKIFNKLETIIKKGWQEEDKEAKEILEQNKLCLKELKKGLSLKKCDFSIGEKFKYLILKKMPNLIKTRDASNLLLLNGRYCEKQRDFAKAIDFYLSSLTFATHISQHNSILSKMIALAIEKQTYVPLRDYLNSKETGKELCKAILVYLSHYEKQHFPAKELVEVEREVFISNIQMTIDVAFREAKKKGALKLNENMKYQRGIFINEILKQGNELANIYYGNFIKAAETGNEDDLKFAIEKVESIKKDASSFGIKDVADAGYLLLDALLGKIERLNKKVAHKIVIGVLVSSIPNFKKVLNIYKSTFRELKELQSLAKVKVEDKE